ncbi:hypothetical protein Rleg5DRAFT_0593 [Rhizobium leguminosarum bv. viciae WSM1455]|jgi:hypothetical protein|nr:hypothetical protein Rleg5DRAFT_0593 [Rhizobium leguminosarum bv. viciae WSM1455]
MLYFFDLDQDSDFRLIGPKIILIWRKVPCPYREVVPSGRWGGTFPQDQFDWPQFVDLIHGTSSDKL